MNLTWEKAMPVYIESLQTGNEKQKQIAVDELMRLAKLVDEQNNK